MTHDAFSQLCRDLQAEFRHAVPERTRCSTGPASPEDIKALVDEVVPLHIAETEAVA